MLLDRPPLYDEGGGHNASSGHNATRARKNVHWSPDNVYFHDFFMGMVVLLMTALGFTLCRVFCCFGN